MVYRYFLIFLFVLLLGSVGKAQEKMVRIATLEDYAPFCIKTGQNTISNSIIPPGKDVKGFSGYCWDVVRESYHGMGYTIHLTVAPWARAMKYVKSGRVDVLFPTGKNSERLKIFHYSEDCTNQANFLIYVRADSRIQWRGLAGLAGQIIGVKRGFNYGDRWEAVTGIIKQDVAKISQGFEMLRAGRIDGFLGYEYNWDYVLKQEKANHRFKKLPAFDSSMEYLVALKKNPHGFTLLNAFDRGKRKIILNGQFAKIRTAWFGE
ncbi:substrate-binding periplasmic protein [Desulfospira joergensenii]|uniref:substrate-binding periplasmic protein n=1 Tax=Desulfospira joergensenii TaxID=53329 RepID=UPI0003B2FAB9|nr:transporter substrate-binding domain-containing protein [Desulfospira joergensenii]